VVQPPPARWHTCPGAQDGYACVTSAGNPGLPRLDFTCAALRSDCLLVRNLPFLASHPALPPTVYARIFSKMIAVECTGP
jgi:hypothetical protein